MITVKGVNYTDTVNRTMKMDDCDAMRRYYIMLHMPVSIFKSNAMHVNEIMKFKTNQSKKEKKRNTDER